MQKEGHGPILGTMTSWKPVPICERPSAQGRELTTTLHLVLLVPLPPHHFQLLPSTERAACVVMVTRGLVNSVGTP